VWSGKACDESYLAGKVDLTLPISVDAARLLHAVFREKRYNHRDDLEIRLRTTITDIKSSTTAKLCSDTQAVENIAWTGVFEFEDYPIAHQPCTHEGMLVARPSIDIGTFDEEHAESLSSKCCVDFDFCWAPQWPNETDFDFMVDLDLNELLLELENGNIFNYRIAP
jgi:hypothetical protein